MTKSLRNTLQPPITSDYNSVIPRSASSRSLAATKDVFSDFFRYHKLVRTVTIDAKREIVPMTTKANLMTTTVE